MFIIKVDQISWFDWVSVLSRAATCSARFSSLTGALVLKTYEPTMNEMPAYRARVDESTEPTIPVTCDMSRPGSANIGIKMKM